MKPGSITHRIIIALIGTTVICLGTYFLLNYLSLEKTYLELLQTDRTVLGEQAKINLALPLFNIDNSQTRQILESLMINENLTAIIVKDSYPPKPIIVACRRGEDGQIAYGGEITPAVDSLVDIHTIVFNNRSIATVEMQYTDRLVNEMLRNTFWSKCFALVFLTLILSLAIFYVLRRSVITPLHHLEQFALAIGQNERSARPAKSDNFAIEINNVQTAMENMLNQLRSRFDDLNRSQEALRESEQLLRQAQKMEAIGLLAGGIAHDFNNILQAIIGYAEILLNNEPAGSTRGSQLQQILQGGKRARDLVKQILTFSRQAQVEKQVFDLKSILSEVMKLLRASIPATVEIHQQIPDDCGCIMADPSQFHQILMNLCTNACHAMEKEKGVLSIKVNIIEVPPENLQAKLPVQAQSFVKIEIGDTGHGIAPAILERIFDPFFTTKAKGEGTGLGLSVVYGIVQDMGGIIDVVSEVGVGSTFTLYLPRFENTVCINNETVEKKRSHGSEKILVVDDEEMITTLMTIMLGEMGYSVVAHNNALAALEAFRQNPASFDLVLTDYAMPGLTGLELTDRILEINANVAVILCTGFSAQVDTEIARARGVSAFIYKPFEQGHLARILRTLLDARMKALP